MFKTGLSLSLVGTDTATISRSIIYNSGSNPLQDERNKSFGNVG